MRTKIERPNTDASTVAVTGAPAIRNGLKTERDTQPVQVRMLKAQLRVLKQLATQEGRNASDVIRDLVDAYIACCLNNWKESPQLDILRATIRAENYYASRHASAEIAVAEATGVAADLNLTPRKFESQLFKRGKFADKVTATGRK